MRGGGFQNLGAREGKDDVKANLAKNEFVMTADAVRGAGGGDIEVGAQRMYDTMKQLERKINFPCAKKDRKIFFITRPSVFGWSAGRSTVERK